MKFSSLPAAVVAAFLFTSPALAASTTIAGTANGGATVTLCAVDNGSGGPKAPCHSVTDTSGAPINPATSEKQDTGNTSLGSIDTKLSSQATAANQSTANSSLSSIDTKLSSQATAANQSTANGSLSSIDTKLTSQATAANQASANTKLDTLHSDLTAAAGLPVANKGGIFFTGTTTALGSSATYTGTARDVGVAASTAQPYAYFNSFFLADQAGTASIECSNDNSTWYGCASSALTASTPLTLTLPVMFRYYRAKLVNGASAQGSLVVNSSFTAG